MDATIYITNNGSQIYYQNTTKETEFASNLTHSSAKELFDYFLRLSSVSVCILEIEKHKIKCSGRE